MALSGVELVAVVLMVAVLVPRDCAELSMQIVEFAREHGRVTMMDAIKLTGASRNTLKQHFRDLTERNHLEQHGSGRGVWYGLK